MNEDQPLGFEVGNDVASAASRAEGDGFFAILEWAADFYFRTGKPAHLSDMFAEKPELKYTGKFEAAQQGHEDRPATLDESRDESK